MKKPVRKKTSSIRSESARARCLRIFERLSEFLDGEMNAKRRGLMDRHLKDCINCCAFFNTFKKTVALCRRNPRRRVSPRVRRQLMERLEKKSRKQKTRLPTGTAVSL
jgi:anti-sigma factor RsiW